MTVSTDFEHMVDRCLQSDEVPFGILSCVSDDDRCWYSIETARETIGYDPQDDGEEWDELPE